MKGKALFHPIRVALTGEGGGPELDLAVPAIERGAALPATRGRWRRSSAAASGRVAFARKAIRAEPGRVRACDRNFESSARTQYASNDR